MFTRTNRSDLTALRGVDFPQRPKHSISSITP